MNHDRQTIHTGATFLEALAAAYADRYDDLSDLCFVFPNKRAGRFFVKHLSEQLGDRTVIAPDVMDVTEFVSRIADVDVAPRIELVFMLYREYARIKGLSGHIADEKELLDFDRFLPWAETVIGDFSEVEQYDVDAESLFQNVKDYRDIASNFLSEEQMEVIRRYFGYSPSLENVEGFWRSVGPEEERNEVKRKFVELWRILPELFRAVTEALSKHRLALPGSAFRLAKDLVRERGLEVLPWRRVVAAGFNALSTSEALMFQEMCSLKSPADGEPYCEFFWDATGPVLTSGRGPASRAMRRYAKAFPQPEWTLPYLEACSVSGMPPSLTIDAAPSNAAQAKIAALTVEEWINGHGEEQIDDAQTAVVVPDENLLMPLLYALPPMKAVNLTMGYSMKFTSIASFMFHYRRLQTRRNRRGELSPFYYQDLQLFLAHPLVHVYAGSEPISELNAFIRDRHKRAVTLDEINAIAPRCAELLAPIPVSDNTADIVEAIDEVLVRIDVALAQRGAKSEERGANDAGEELRVLNTKLERAQISIYRMALTRLLQSVESLGIRMHFYSVFHLVDRLLAGEKVTFEGEPLEGLQVMGLLETRALDFKRLVIMSMNDKVMPRRARKRTFIPDSLRRGYGLPTSNQTEELYAYYFYRLLSRAGDVTLIYDARAGEGMRSGGQSRFLLQLEMIHCRESKPGACEIRHRDFSFRFNGLQLTREEVEKTPVVMERLHEFTLDEKGRNLSASALMTYCECPVKFYYKNVVGLSDDRPKENYIDAVTTGNVVHAVMQKLYVPEDLSGKYLKPGERVHITEEFLRDILDHPQRVEDMLRREINKRHFMKEPERLDDPLEGQTKLVAERMKRMVLDTVAYDMTLAPFDIVGAEIQGHAKYDAGDGLKVNMVYYFDRVDLKDGRYRVVDYKTGSAHIKANDFSKIFSGDYHGKYLVQLMLYSKLLKERICHEEHRPADSIKAIDMAIYDVNTIRREGEAVPEVAKEPMRDFLPVEREFDAEASRVLHEMFDSGEPFRPCADGQACAFCAFADLCQSNG